MIFELTGAPHVQDGKEYTKGDRIETDSDLCKMFRGKFKLLESGVASPGTPVPQPKIPKSKNTENSNVKKLASGLTVTMSFLETKDTGLDITKTGEDEYQIVKNGFVFADGVFTRAEVLIYLKNLNAKVDS